VGIVNHGRMIWLRTVSGYPSRPHSRIRNNACTSLLAAPKFAAHSTPIFLNR